jgi:hypothetical protein
MTCTAINSQYGQLKPAQVRFAAFLALRLVPMAGTVPAAFAAAVVAAGWLSLRVL